jgi:hypothetical protein
MANSEQEQFQVPDPAELQLEMGAREYSPTMSSTDDRLESILRRHEANLLAIPGVTMVSRQMVEPGRETIIIGVIDSGVLARLPGELEGVPVRGEVTGPIEAL